MLKRYDLPSIKSEGWAIIVIDTSIGFFSAVSDWGAYAYVWSTPGCEFRKFLARLDEHYLHSKLMVGRGDRREYDEDLARRAAWRCLLNWIREKRKAARKAARWESRRAEAEKIERAIDEEKEHYASASFFSYVEMYDWGSNSRMAGVYELADYFVPNRQCAAFCKKAMPRFQAVLRAEIDAEAVQATTVLA